MADLQLELYKTTDCELRRQMVRSWLLRRFQDLREVPGGGLTWLGAFSRPPFCLRCSERHWPTRELTCVPLQKPSIAGISSGGSSLPVERGKVLIGFASVLDFLSTRSWPDGSPRVTGTITLSMESCLWKACVKCRDTGGVAFVSAETPDLLLKAVDKGLDTNTLEWRNDRFQEGNGKRRH